ncbi:MAG: DNA translocase FtsK 4TM domain-containing protein [Pseudomonadota bacterium]
MAKKYKIKKKKTNFLSRLIPESLQVFIARRVIDGFGVAYLGVAAFLFIAMLSYHPDDPSLNSVSSGPETFANILGKPGAYSADLMIQIIGLGGFLLSAGLAVWGISILKRRSLSPFWLRALGLPFGLILFSGFLAIIPSFGLFERAYLGGSAGQLLMQNVADFFFNLGVGAEIILSASFLGLIGAGFIALGVAVRKAEARYIGLMIWFGVTTAATFIANTAIAIYDWVRHYGDPDYKPKRTNAKKRTRPTITASNDEENKVLERKEPAFEEDTTQNADIKVVAPARNDNKKQQVSQTRFQLFDGGEWELPPIDLVQEIPEDHEDHKADEKTLRMNAELLQNILEDFNVKGEIVSIHPGPVVTLYELEPAPGVKSSRVIGLADDIARSMSAISVRAAVVPGRNVIGIEIPNKKRQTVYMREMLISRDYDKTKAALPLILGKDIGGRPIIADLARMPHLLVAGTTGSGKSVAVNTMIMSLLYRLPPEKCRFIMIDPKMLELSVYDDIPHLLSPVVTEPGKAVVALKWLVAEMEERYRAMSKLGVRNIDGYNARLGEARKKGEALMRKVQTGFDPDTGKAVYEEQPLDLTDLPYIVVIVDEFADLMLVAGKDVEAAIQRLAQMARAAGIHIIMATQRPSVDVITGVIKANFPTRISFSVTSKIDSRTILGEGGAEQLLGMGDMLYMAAGGQITRVHGPFSSDADVENVVNFLKAQAEPSYLDDITEGSGDFTGAGLGGLYGDNENEKIDELYDEAVALVARERKASTSFVQRYLQIGYNRAARIVEEMEKQGVIGPANHVGKREILVSDLSEAS